MVVEVRFEVMVIVEVMVMLLEVRSKRKLFFIKDQRTEIVLATTALVAVVALFLRYVRYLNSLFLLVFTM